MRYAPYRKPAVTSRRVAGLCEKSANESYHYLKKVGIFMKKNALKPYAGFIALTLISGSAAGLLVRNSFETYTQLQKPPASPPGIVFPIVWTLLYLLMGIGAAMVWRSSPGTPQRSGAILVFALQLAVNLLWPFLFFGLQAYFFSFLWLLLLLALAITMTVFFAQLSPTAAWLQVPYLLWLAFAAYLNAGVWLLNR